MIRGFLVTLVVLSIALFANWNLGSKADVERLLARLPEAEAEARRVGVPLAAADLAPDPPLTPEENAALLLMEANEAWAGVVRAHGEEARRWWDILRQAISEPSAEHDAAAKRILEAFEPGFALSSLAADRPRAYFGLEESEIPGDVVDLDRLASTKDWMNRFAMRAQLRARWGDRQGALRDLEAAFSLTAHGTSGQTMIDFLTRVSTEHVGLWAAEGVAAAQSGDAAFLREIETVVSERAGGPVDLREYLRGEALSTLELSRWMVRASDPYLRTMAEPESWVLRRTDRARLLPADKVLRAQYVRLLLFWNQVFSELGVGVDRFDEVLRQAWATHGKAGDPTSFALRFFLGDDSFVREHWPDAERRRQAQAAKTRGLLAALRFRAENGRFPTSLAEAGVELTDPFDGQSLRYRVEGDGVRVWSIGRDRIDDGGVALLERAGPGQRSDDLVSRYPIRHGTSVGAAGVDADGVSE